MNEEECLPCLHNCPPYQDKLKQDADDMCMICFTEALSAAPAIQVCVLKHLLDFRNTVLNINLHVHVYLNWKSFFIFIFS